MSISSKASNVLLAKCRAKYGRRLTFQDINAISGSRTVAEITSYLKSSTHYSTALEGIDNSFSHRGILENALIRTLYDDLSSLCRYELSVGEWFVDYIMLQSEIEQIMHFLRLLSAQRPGDFIFSLPEFFANHSHIDLRALSVCKSYADFLAVMQPSRFIKILRAFTPLDGEPIDCAAIEHALYVKYYDTVFSIIDRHYHGSARDELKDLLGTQLDLINFSHLYRLKKYYNASPDTVHAMIYHNYYQLRPGVLRELLEAPDGEAALEIFNRRTTYGRSLKQDIISRTGIEAATEDLMYRKARRLLRSSVNPTSVLVAYIILARIEVRDIITAAQGVHYGLDQKDILELIVIDDEYAR